MTRTKEALTVNRALALGTCLGAIAVLSVAAVAGTVLFEDDFSGYRPGADGAPLWQTDSGSWHVTPAGFEGADCEGHFAVAGARTGRNEWTDYTLSLRLRVVSLGSDWRDGPWLGVRYRNSAAGYTVGFSNRMTALHKASAGTQTDDANPLAQSPVTIKDNAWHSVTVTAKGRRIAVALDGKTILDATDNDWNASPAVASGGIVLGARRNAGAPSTRVLFDDVRVEAAGDASDSLKFTRADALGLLGKETSRLAFMRSRAERRYTRVPREVLAFYYTWYGLPERHGQVVHWGKIDADKHDLEASTHYPATGAYDSHDPAVIDRHIAQAKQAGLTGFIATWWGQGTFDDRAFETVIDRAEKADFKVTVYWETAPGKGQAQIDQAVRDLLYVLNKYGNRKPFLKVDGKPVIFVYGRVMGEVPLKSWSAVFDGVKESYGGDFLLLADGYQESYARVFDGLHTYNICGWVQKKKPDELRALAAKDFAGAVRLARQHGRVSCLDLIPGYDDTKIRKPGLDAWRQDGQTYRVLWEEAVKADPDWVLITSWNEWHEGSEIEPSWEDGDKYLKLSAEYAPRFLGRPAVEAQARPAAALDPAKAEALRKLYAGKTVGLLPDYGSQAAFWLADTGVAIKELSWEELLDPQVFNAKALPLVLNAAGEGYVRSLKADGDVERALVRYLGEGGLLMTIPFQPYPFYYDETGQPNLAAGRLGFPIAGSGAGQRDDLPEGANVRGWEQPPAGAELTFHVDTQALPGVPATAPFPAAGDQRWRPATQALVAKGDVYLPLARLTDAAGKWYGDGIAYVEHKTSAPKNGKNLYVWMRMPEVLGAEEALFALFQFAAGKVGFAR